VSFYGFAGWLLNQEAFSALVIFASAAALLRPDIKTLAVLFWGAGYFSTQVPLSLGWELTFFNKYELQSLVSVMLILFYLTIFRTKYTVFSAICETVMTLFNSAWVLLLFVGAILDRHQWWWWAFIATMNYASFISICLNKWGENERERRPVESSVRSNIALDHVLVFHGIIRKVNQGMARWEDWG